MLLEPVSKVFLGSNIFSILLGLFGLKIIQLRVGDESLKAVYRLEIHEYSAKLGHVPIIDNNPRSGEKSIWIRRLKHDLLKEVLPNVLTLWRQSRACQRSFESHDPFDVRLGGNCCKADHPAYHMTNYKRNSISKNSE